MIATTTKAQNPTMTKIMTSQLPHHPYPLPHHIIVTISLLVVGLGDRLTFTLHLDGVDIGVVSMKVC